MPTKKEKLADRKWMIGIGSVFLLLVLIAVVSSSLSPSTSGTSNIASSSTSNTSTSTQGNSYANTLDAQAGLSAEEATLVNQTVTSQASNGVPQASYSQMVSSCQSITDGNLRNGLYEQDFAPQSDTQPRQVSDNIYYNASQSTCYFTEHLIRYPAVYSTSDPYMVDAEYLYAAAISPNGVIQNAAQGDNVTGGPLSMAYCIISTYQFPTMGSTETNCFDFQLKQSGAGTSNYHASALGVGTKISQSQYAALVQEHMGATI